MLGVIYFLQESETKRVKIGHTRSANSLYERFKTLQAGNSQELKIIGLAEGSSKEERYLHESFDQHRVRGEFFELHTDIESYIRSVNTKNSYVVDALVSELEHLKVFISGEYGMNIIGDPENWKEENLVLSTVQEFIDIYGFFHYDFIKGQKYFKNTAGIKPKANYRSMTDFRGKIEQEFGCVFFNHVIDGKKTRFKVYGCPVSAKKYLKEAQ